MNREDITRWATQCKMPYDYVTGEIVQIEKLESFAALVAAKASAAEREAIAQSLDKQADLAPDKIDRQWAQEMAAAVRARSNT